MYIALFIYYQYMLIVHIFLKFKCRTMCYPLRDKYFITVVNSCANKHIDACAYGIIHNMLL